MGGVYEVVCGGVGLLGFVGRCASKVLLLCRSQWRSAAPLCRCGVAMVKKVWLAASAAPVAAAGLAGGFADGFAQRGARSAARWPGLG